MSLKNCRTAKALEPEGLDVVKFIPTIEQQYRLIEDFARKIIAGCNLFRTLVEKRWGAEAPKVSLWRLWKCRVEDGITTPPSVLLLSGLESLRSLSKFWVCFHSQFGFVETVHFFFFRHPYAHCGLEDEPDDGTGDRDENTDQQDAPELGQERTAAENSDRQSAPDAGHKVGGDRTDNIVDFQLVEERYGDDHE